MFRLGTI